MTGSCYLFGDWGKKLLVDCGMRQGPDEYKSQAFSFDAQSIDCVLRHIAHIDHSGLLPLLTKKVIVERFMQRAQHATWRILCSGTVRISRCLKRNGATGKEKRAGREEYIPVV